MNNELFVRATTALHSVVPVYLQSLLRLCQQILLFGLVGFQHCLQRFAVLHFDSQPCIVIVQQIGGLVYLQ